MDSIGQMRTDDLSTIREIITRQTGRKRIKNIEEAIRGRDDVGAKTHMACMRNESGRGGYGSGGLRGRRPEMR